MASGITLNSTDLEAGVSETLENAVAVLTALQTVRSWQGLRKQVGKICLLCSEEENHG